MFDSRWLLSAVSDSIWNTYGVTSVYDLFWTGQLGQRNNFETFAAFDFLRYSLYGLLHLPLFLDTGTLPLPHTSKWSMDGAVVWWGQGLGAIRIELWCHCEDYDSWWQLLWCRGVLRLVGGFACRLDQWRLYIDGPTSRIPLCEYCYA